MIRTTDEVSRQVVVFGFRATKFSAELLYKAIKKATTFSDNSFKKAYQSSISEMEKARKNPSGRQTVGQLVSQGQSVSTMDIRNKEEFRDFSKTLRKYRIDYAIQKDTSVYPPKYVVFFKGKDTDVITQAFKELVATEERKHPVDAEWVREEEKKRKPSIREKLKSIKERNEAERKKQAHRERPKVKKNDKELGAREKKTLKLKRELTK